MMSAQHMVEHLLLTVSFSNGQATSPCYYEAAKAAKIKAFVIDSDNDITIGFRAPMLPVGETVDLQFADLPTAVAALLEGVAAFKHYFAQNPTATPTHPTMDKLNHQEWIIFHNKHFKHHFKQFGLI
jgi:hypothetical protein